MAWQDSDPNGGKICLKHSMVPGETIGSTGLKFGEMALNVPDAKLYYKKADGSIGSMPGGYTGVISIFDNGQGPSHLLTFTNGILTAYETS